MKFLKRMAVGIAALIGRIVVYLLAVALVPRLRQGDHFVFRRRRS